MYSPRVEQLRRKRETYEMPLTCLVCSATVTGKASTIGGAVNKVLATGWRRHHTKPVGGYSDGFLCAECAAKARPGEVLPWP